MYTTFIQKIKSYFERYDAALDSMQTTVNDIKVDTSAIVSANLSFERVDSGTNIAAFAGKHYLVDTSSGVVSFVLPECNTATIGSISISDVGGKANENAINISVNGTSIELDISLGTINFYDFGNKWVYSIS